MDNPRNNETCPAYTWLAHLSDNRTPSDPCDPWRWRQENVGFRRKESTAGPRGIPPANLDTTRFAHLILFGNRQSNDWENTLLSSNKFDEGVRCSVVTYPFRNRILFRSSVLSWYDPEGILRILAKPRRSTWNPGGINVNLIVEKSAQFRDNFINHFPGSIVSIFIDVIKFARKPFLSIRTFR